ncbi:hypothetical protein [Bradyrhizobium sp. SZCCHNRI1073]|uniref:hypothetical protein n=1 Tax=Bradyrhizobium sp. SZCCHNRI1073 TaxID=3057280 RepID=UPI002917076F|nr:hypothetical protein [Bradyrhizobium sp. SZCCHNRI1073]
MTIKTFRAGPDGSTPQTGIPNASYTTVHGRTDFSYLGVSGFDTGGEWDNTTFTWTPQAGPVEWDFQVWAMDFGGTNANLTATVFKNGVDFQAGIGGAQVNTFVNTGSAQNSGKDVANGADTYQFKIYMTTADGLNNGWLNADPRHIWIIGRSFGT